MEFIPNRFTGKNNRPDKIPESLCRTSYWYRTVFTVPKTYAGKKIWLNFDGINYAAEVWVNGKNIGAIKGAFTRGIFDVSSLVKPQKEAALAVLITPQPHPGNPHEHTLANGMGGNGGVSAIDGPTFSLRDGLGFGFRRFSATAIREFRGGVSFRNRPGRC